MQQQNNLRLCGIEPESIVDGPGFRYVVFVQGCPHNCKGCHNPQSHAFDGGYDRSIESIIGEIKENPLLTGVTFSGGEPFCQAEGLYNLAVEVKKLNKNIYVYSGFTYEQLIKKEDPYIKKLLSVCDVLIDGPYVEEKRNLLLKFRGSENQRIIDLKQSNEEPFLIEV